MWSNEQLADAKQVLWNGSETRDIQRVEDITKDKKEKEIYLVVGDVTYTDPLYLKALEALISDGKFSKCGCEDGRETYKRAS